MMGLLDDNNLSDLLNQASGDAVMVREISIDLISPDPNNPRKRFSLEKMEELRGSIEDSGLLQHITVREDSNNEGRFIINTGHRRFEAFKQNNAKTVPVIVNNNFNAFNQLAENLYREDLFMSDLASAVDRMMKEKGWSRSEMARRLRKSPAYITQLLSIIDASPALTEAIDVGRVSDRTIVNALVNLEKTAPEKVIHFLETTETITRKSLDDLKNEIEGNGKTDTIESNHNIAAEFQASTAASAVNQGPGLEPDNDIDESPLNDGDSEPTSTKAEKMGKNPDVTTDTPKKAHKARITLVVSYSDKMATIITDKAPKSSKHVWLRFDTGEEKEVQISGVILCEVREG